MLRGSKFKNKITNRINKEDIQKCKIIIFKLNTHSTRHIFLCHGPLLNRLLLSLHLPRHITTPTTKPRKMYSFFLRISNFSPLTASTVTLYFYFLISTFPLPESSFLTLFYFYVQPVHCLGSD